MTISRFIHLCLASIALTSLTFLFVLVPVTTPPSAWAIQEPPVLTTLPSTPPPEISVTTSYNYVNDFTQLIDLNSFQYIMNVKSCNETNMPILLVIIHSAPKNLEKRNSIRKTWGSYASNLNDSDNNYIRVLFMLGKTKLLNEQSKLLEEQLQYNDIIQGNFIDKYRNITYKHVMAFKWITYNCNTIKYVLKTDDDVFINMPNLIKFIPSLPNSSLIFCDVIKNAYVKRSWRSKWRVSFKEFSDKVYPDYCAGWAILYSGDVVKRLYYQAQNYNYFWVDDVHLTGVLAKKEKIKHLPAKNWKLEQKISDKIILNSKWPISRDKYLIGPYDTSPNIIQSLWNILINTILTW